VSAQLALRNAVVARLAAAPAVASGRIGVDGDDVLAVDDPDDVIVELQASAGDRPFAGASGPLQWTTDVQVTCRARAMSGIDAVARADELLAEAWARVAAMTPPAGVTDMQVVPQILFRGQAADIGVASIEFTVRFVHQTAPQSLTPRS
jgi:hypothetical protein